MRLLILFAFSALAFTQTQAGRFQLQQGTSLPGTCSTGEVFFKSNEAAGQNVYGCTATNTWTLQAGGGAGYDPFALTKMRGADEFCHPVADYPSGTTSELGTLHVRVVNQSGTGAVSSITPTAQYPCGFKFSTGGGAGNESYLKIGGWGPLFDAGQTATQEVIFKIPTITDVKVSIPFSRYDQLFPPCWDLVASGHCFAVTYDTSQGDTTWKIRECDTFATNCSTTDSGMTLVAGRTYRVRLVRDSATTAQAVIVQQNDGTTYTSPSIAWSPTAGTFYVMTFRLHTITAAVRDAELYRVAYENSPATRY